MKRLIDYTESELLALDEAGVNTLINLECACEGVPLPSARPVEPEATSGPTLTLFSVGGFNFRTEANANAIAEMIRDLGAVDLAPASGNWSCRDHVPGEACSVSVNKTKVFDPETYPAIQQEREAYRLRKATYESDLREWRKASEARGDIADRVWGKVFDAQEEKRKAERFNSLLAEYTELADGDEDQARKFLFKAHPEAVDYFHVFEEASAP